jgi:hypothetical protein
MYNRGALVAEKNGMNGGTQSTYANLGDYYTNAGDQRYSYSRLGPVAVYNSTNNLSFVAAPPQPLAYNPFAIKPNYGAYSTTYDNLVKGPSSSGQPYATLDNAYN